MSTFKVKVVWSSKVLSGNRLIYDDKYSVVKNNPGYYGNITMKAALRPTN